MKAPATGTALVFAVGTEPSWGVPASTYTAYDPILAVAVGMTPSTLESSEVNRTGQRKHGASGARTGKSEFAVDLRPSILHEFLHHLIGAYSETEIEAGLVYQGTFEPPDWTARAETSFTVLWAKGAADKGRDLGVRYGSMTIEIPDDGIVTAKFSGQIAHQSPWSSATQSGGLGSYTLGPWLRGPVAQPLGGDRIHLKITQVFPTVEFKVYHGGAEAPTYTTLSVAMAVDETGAGKWQNVNDQNGDPVGIIRNNAFDPLEVLFPGSAEERAPLSAGDEFVLEREWAVPALGAFADEKPFTGAHLSVRYRLAGSADPWIDLDRESAQITLANPLTARPGRNYPSRMVHKGPLETKLTFKQALTDSKLRDHRNRGDRLEIVAELEGRPIGTGTVQTLFRTHLHSAELTKVESPVSNDDVVIEDVEASAKLPDDGSPSVTFSVVSPRSWTP